MGAWYAGEIGKQESLNFRRSSGGPLFNIVLIVNNWASGTKISWENRSRVKCMEHTHTHNNKKPQKSIRKFGELMGTFSTLILVVILMYAYVYTEHNVRIKYVQFWHINYTSGKLLNIWKSQNSINQNAFSVESKQELTCFTCLFF